MKPEYHVDPIVPLEIGDGLSTVEDIRLIRKKYGIRRFFLCGPGLEIQISGFPGMDVYERIAEKIRTVKAALSDTDIEIYWWCAPSINCGLHAPYQHIVNFDGTESESALCPLDAGFRRDFSGKVARVAELAGPGIIQFEDDFELSNHLGVTFGCFCPLHLKAFSEKAGREYTREELVRIFQEDKRETLPLRRLFRESAKESLCLLASDIRTAVDRVAPETRISVCEPGPTDIDGYVSVEEPRAFAGKNTVPLIRVWGSQYCSPDSPRDLPAVLGHTMYTAERLPSDFEWMHESDTFPHTTFWMSAAQLETEIAAALFMGAGNTLLYAGQYLDFPTEESAYFSMYAKNAKRFEALRKAARGGRMEGVRIIYDPFCCAAKRISPRSARSVGYMCYILGRLGIPYSTRYGSPALLAGQMADVLSDAEITDILKSGVLLDIEAARILENRGFGDLIGVSVKDLGTARYTHEFIADIPDFSGIRGRRIYNYSSTLPFADRTFYANPVPLSGVEVLSWFRDDTGKPVQAGMVRFANRLGGRVCVLACALNGNETSSLFCYRKQEMIRIVLNWLGGSGLLSAANVPHFWLLQRETPEGTLLFVDNILTDVREELPLHLPEKFRNAAFSELDGEGNWIPADAVRTESGPMILKGPFLPLRPRIFRIF